MPRLRQGVEAAMEWGRRVIPTGWEEAWGRVPQQHQGSPRYDRVAVGSPTTGYGQEQASSAGGGTYRSRGAMG